MGGGALVGGGTNAIRQLIQIYVDKSRKEFSSAEVVQSAAIGAVAVPGLVVMPELAVPLAAFGVASGSRNYLAVTMLLPLLTLLARWHPSVPRQLKMPLSDKAPSSDKCAARVQPLQCLPAWVALA